MEYLGIDIGGTKCSVVRGTDRCSYSRICE